MKYDPKTSPHGWLVVDKPLGMSSHQVVGKVRRILNSKKIGHAGTLDPLASGVLPLAIGEATKTMQFAMNTTKTYRFTICFGNSTTTDDAEGEVLDNSEHRPSRQDILDILHDFTGEIEQIPPAYSAIKVDGKRAYALARKGETPEMTARNVYIHDLTLLDIPDVNHATLEVTCGKGTYVRSLARDIAQKLGSCGHVSYLRRTQVGNFLEKDTILLENLEKIVHSAPPSDGLSEVLLPVDAVLDDIPVLHLD